jgi:predicted dehydrogenase
MAGKLRIGVVGLGNMGSGHLKFIKETPTCELGAVCDICKAKADKFAAEYGVKAYYDAKKMFASGDIDAAIIAVPHYSHPDLSIAAMEKGLHVITEKPLAVHKLDAQRMIDAHKKHPKVKFAAMFQQRTDDAHKKLKELIDSGELGKIIRVNWTITNWYRTESYYASGGWRATWGGEGGGVLLNQCPHNLDLFQWFFGMPSKIRANCHIGKYHKIEVEDEVTAYMEYKNGMTAVFITSTGEAPGTNRLEIAADRGRVVLEGGKITFTRNTESMIKFCKENPNGFATPQTWDVSIPAAAGASHQKIIANFADAVLKGEKLWTPAEEGINAVELATSMLYSSFNDCTVELPLDAVKYDKMLKKLIKSSKFVKAPVKEQHVDMAASFGK